MFHALFYLESDPDPHPSVHAIETVSSCAIILLSWGGADCPDYMERPSELSRLSELTFELRLHTRLHVLS